MGSITKTKTISVTPVVTAAGAYTAGDALGGLLTFANAAEKGRGSGVVQTVILIDNDVEEDATELHLFNQTFTATADNAAFDPSDADLANYVGSINVSAGSYTAFTDNSVATVNNAGLAFELVSGGTSLFGQLVTRGTPTYAATDDVTVKITVLQD
jgi:hypothetical protein